LLLSCRLTWVAVRGGAILESLLLSLLDVRLVFLLLRLLDLLLESIGVGDLSSWDGFGNRLHLLLQVIL